MEIPGVRNVLSRDYERVRLGMVEFGEPLLEGLTSDGKRKGGWHKKAAASWRTKERKEKARKKWGKKPVKFRGSKGTKRYAQVYHPCPKCYAPVGEDGVCTGAYSLANGGLHNER